MTAQDAAAGAAAPSPRWEYLGVERCERCHDQPTAADREKGITDFVRLNESEVWLEQDRHARAFTLIDPATSALGKQICDRLGIADIREAQQCLNCHSNWIQGEPRPPTYERGVACESCHGPSSGWDRDHSLDKWRTLSIGEKEGLGMVNVRDPARKADQCLSCHVGSPAQGKILSHDMYAAGHPPLPGFELGAFLQQMPPHWRHISQKPDFKFREEFIRQAYPRLAMRDASAPPEAFQMQAAVVGAGRSLQSMLELLAVPVEGGGNWPELANYDCYACHHELQSETWRAAPATGPLGRPPAPRWSYVLSPLLLARTSGDRDEYQLRSAEYQARWGEFQAALHERPFGTPARVAATAEALRAWLSPLIEQAANTALERRSVIPSMRLLCRLPAEQTGDFHAARQVAWALSSLYEDAAPKPDNDPQIRAALAELADQLSLRLTAERHGSESRFDPALFRERLEALDRLLATAR